MKKHHFVDVYAMLNAIAIAPSSFPAGWEGERERLRAIHALADYAFVSHDLAATIVDNMEAGEAFAIGSDTVSWQSIPATTAADGARPVIG